MNKSVNVLFCSFLLLSSIAVFAQQDVVLSSEILVIHGTIVDIGTRKAIDNAVFNMAEAGEEILETSIDEEGNFRIVLEQGLIDFPVRIEIKAKGYKKFTMPYIFSEDNNVIYEVGLVAQKNSKDSLHNNELKMHDDPFNSLVIRF